MRNRDIIADILKELKSAKKKHPNWHQHPAAQAVIVVEESGELMKACLEFKYERDWDSNTIKGIPVQEYIEFIRKEAIQTAVTAIRFLENFDK